MAMTEDIEHFTTFRHKDKKLSYAEFFAAFQEFSISDKVSKKVKNKLFQKVYGVLKDNKFIKEY